MSEPRALVEHFFRHEFGRLCAVLTRSLGVRRLALVEDVVQAALVQALETWSRRGVPEDPAGRLYRTTRNLAKDATPATSGRRVFFEHSGFDVYQPWGKQALPGATATLRHLVYRVIDSSHPKGALMPSVACPGCGANLNEEECRCAPTEPDSRWSKLSELKERLGS